MKPAIVEIHPDGKLVFPYNEATKDRIKALGSKWNANDKAWFVPADKLGEARNILTETAATLGWDIHDYSINSAEDIEKQQEDEQLKHLNAHQIAFVEALKRMPDGTLKLEGWQDGILTLGIKTYLFPDIFNGLKFASLKTFRQNIIRSYMPKESFGYKLTAIASPEIIGLLAEKHTEYLELFDIENPTVIEDGEVLHDGTRICILAESVQMESWQIGNNPWTIGVYNNRVYVVLEREKFVEDWLGQSEYTVVGRVFVRTERMLPEWIKIFHLEEYFAQWAKSKVESNALSTIGDARNPTSYKHISEALLKYAAGSPATRNLIGWSADDMKAIVLRIIGLKEAAANAKVASDKANAESLAASKLETLQKGEMGTLLNKHQIAFKKSATKAELIQLMVANRELCEEIIGL